MEEQTDKKQEEVSTLQAVESTEIRKEGIK
jgi:hypothetical protein